MRQPPLGICLPVEFVRVRDGDTPVFALRGGMQIAIRMIDVYAPELADIGGKEAAANLHDQLAAAKEIRIHIPLASPGPDERLDVFDILRSITFDRVQADVWADGRLVQ